MQHRSNGRFVAVIFLMLTPGLIRAQEEEITLTPKGAWFGGHNQAATGIQVVGDIAYISVRRWSVPPDQWGGLSILNVSNPGNPMLLGQLDLAAGVNDLKVTNGYAYLACGSPITGTNDPGSLEIVDVSNPAAPVRVGGISTSGRAQRIRLVGNLAYLPLSTHWTGTNLLGALAICNVSNPTNPVAIGGYDTGGSATDVQVAGNRAYLADGVADLVILDVTDPVHPQWLGSYSTNLPMDINIGEGGGPATFIESVGGLIYASGFGEYHAFDVADSLNPVRLGFNHETTYPPSAVALGGKYFCTVMGLAGPFGSASYLYLEDVSDPRHPRFVGGLDPQLTPWIANGLHLVDKHLYVAAGYLGLLVYEIQLVPRITSIVRRGGNIVLSWSAEPDFKLQRTGSLSQPDWKDVPVSLGLSSLELPLAGDQEFFRLVKE